MIRDLEEARRYLRFYRHVTTHMIEPYDPDSSMEVGAALCNRAAMGDLTDLQEELAAVDEEFAVAMAQASDPWREKIAEWPEACEFATSPWWRAIESRSRELRSAKAV